MKAQMFVGGALLLGLLAIAGCGPTSQKDIPTVPVRGTVTLDGQPMADGEIVFTTVAEGYRASLPVKNGSFEGQVAPGDRNVEIYAYKEVPGNTEMYGPNAEPSRENYIDPQYNTNSQMRANVMTEGTAELKFDVKSKK